MANLIDTDLLLDTLSQKVITTLGNYLAPLNAFTTDFSDESMPQQTKSVQIPVFSATAVAVQTNPTNFETGDTNTTNAAVSVNHISRSFFLTSAQLNQRFRIEQLAEKNLQTFADAIIDIALTPVTTTNFGANNIVVTQANITTSTLKTAWAAVAKSPRKHVLLDAQAMSAFLPTSLTAYGSDGTNSGSSVPTVNGMNLKGLCGFDSFHLNTRWTGAGGNVYGFACAPSAIAQVAGVPITGPSAANSSLRSTVVTHPGLGLSIQLNTWYSVSSRQQWCSYDVMYGAGYGQDSNAGFVIASA